TKRRKYRDKTDLYQAATPMRGQLSGAARQTGALGARHAEPDGLVRANRARSGRCAQGDRAEPSSRGEFEDHELAAAVRLYDIDDEPVWPDGHRLNTRALRQIDRRRREGRRGRQPGTVAGCTSSDGNDQ